MADDLVPDDLREFVLRHIDSVAQLEALLLLRANPHEEWDVAKTTKRLYAAEQEVVEILGRLCADGLLSCHETVYRYAPQTPELQGVIDRLAASYARHLIPITNMIRGP